MKQENKTEINARSSFLGILPNLNFVTATKEKKSLVDIHENNFFSHFGIHQGVQVIPRLHFFRFVVLSLLGLLTSHLVGTSLIHSAYAASYVNVSSGGGNSGTSSSETVSPGIVNLGSIKPSSTGTMATGNDTLTIHTDCSAGYKVYVSGQNGKSTNLINSNAENPTSPTTSELISSASNLPNSTSATSSPSSATALNSNTWGINGNNTEVGSNLYYGLPSYSDATAYPLVTKADVPEESTVPIYYGVKVNTDITPGTYTGDVLYTVIMDSTCLPYTVVFNSNGGTGTMSNQSIMYNTEEELKQNTYTRSGYGFLGWSTNEKGKTGNAVNGIGTLDDVEYSDLQEVNNLTTGGSTITLYAIWIKVDGNMQSWNGCSALATNSIVRLIDTRDNKVYAIKKTPDGKCWMLQNLTISGTGLKVSALNNTNTNIPSTDSTSYYLPPRGRRYSTTLSITDPNVLSATDYVNFGGGGDTESQYPQVGYRTATPDDSNARISAVKDTSYYNFYTASLGFSYGGDGKTSGSSPRDICPKGWHMPWTSDSGSTRNGNAEFYTLGLAYNSDSSVWTNYIAPGSTGSSSPNTANTVVAQNMISGNPDSLDRFANNGAIGFTHAGYYHGPSLINIGSYGNYRSSSILSTYGSYYLEVINTSLYSQYSSGSRYNGYSVRCVVDNYTISFDANGGTGTMDNQVVFGNNSSTQTIKSNTFTKTGYHLLGWSTDSSATTATYTDGQTLTTALAENGRTIKLYAVWAPNTYTINYAAGSTDGSCSVSGTAATYNQNVTLSSSKCTKSGYDQKGWSTSSSGNSKTYDLGQTLTMPNFTTTNGGTYTLYPYFENMYTLSFNANGLCKTNLPSTQTWTGSATSHTFTIPSTAPTCYAPATFSNYTYNGSTYNKGATITLTSSSPSATLTANYTKSCTPSASTGCKLADNNTWILGNSGNSIQWKNMFTNETKVAEHNATLVSGVCPTGYSAPTITVLDMLIKAYGGTPSNQGWHSGYGVGGSGIYSVLGLSEDRNFWSSTEGTWSSRAFYMYVYSAGASTSIAPQPKSSSYYALCYK